MYRKNFIVSIVSTVESTVSTVSRVYTVNTVDTFNSIKKVNTVNTSIGAEKILTMDRHILLQPEYNKQTMICKSI